MLVLFQFGGLELGRLAEGGGLQANARSDAEGAGRGCGGSAANGEGGVDSVGVQAELRLGR